MIETSQNRSVSAAPTRENRNLIDPYSGLPQRLPSVEALANARNPFGAARLHCLNPKTFHHPVVAAIQTFAAMSVMMRQTLGPLSSLRLVVDEPVRGYLDAAYRGDLDAWRSLALSMPAESYRTLLKLVWKHEYVSLIGYPRRPIEVRALIAAAKFDVSDLPRSELLTIWRGTAGVSANVGASGLSWSLSEAPAWVFARGMSALGKGSPLVQVAKVPRSEVIAFFDERRNDLAEVVTAHPVSALSEVLPVAEPSPAAKSELSAYWGAEAYV